MGFDHFSFIAPVYARATYSHAAVMREVAALPVSGRLLDIGGGTGRVASVLRDSVDEIVIADVSFGMLSHSPRADFRAVGGASENLPFADSSFERIIMVDALHHVANHPLTAMEMFRVLKPNGVLVIEEPDIRTFGVKLIAIAEKLLLMRSHFLAPDAILKLFEAGEKSVKSVNGTAWIVIRKK